MFDFLEKSWLGGGRFLGLVYNLICFGASYHTFGGWEVKDGNIRYMQEMEKNNDRRLCKMTKVNGKGVRVVSILPSYIKLAILLGG